MRTASGCETWRRPLKGPYLSVGLYGTSVRPALLRVWTAGFTHGVRRLGTVAWALRGLQASGAKMEPSAGYRGAAASEG